MKLQKNNPQAVAHDFLDAWQRKNLPDLLSASQKTFQATYPAINACEMFMQEIKAFKVIRTELRKNQPTMRFVIVSIDFGEGTEEYKLPVNCERYIEQQIELPSKKMHKNAYYKPSLNGFWGVYPATHYKKVN